MLKVYNCIVTAHDLRLVVLAAIVCVLASFAALVRLSGHVAIRSPAIRPRASRIGAETPTAPSYRSPWLTT